MIEKSFPRRSAISLAVLALMCLPINAFSQASPITVGDGGYASPAPGDCEGDISEPESIQSTSADECSRLRDERWVIQLAEFVFRLV
jgi:hypothetical protein